MNKTLTYAALVFIAGASYGFTVPAVKIAQSFNIDVNDFLPLQYLIAFFIMVLAMCITRVKLVEPKELGKLVAMGALTSCTSLCYYRAVTLLPSAVALTLLFQFAWIGVVIDCVVKRQLPSRSTVLAVAVILAGTLLAAGVLDEGVSALDPLGVVLGLASAVFYALFLFFSGRVGTSHALPLRSGMLCLGGFALTSCANPTFFTGPLFEPILWPFALVMSLLGIVIPVCLISYASPKLSPSVVSIMASSELPAGVLMAWGIVGDTPSALTLVGVVLILAGIVIDQLPAALRTR